jgi:CRISPR-associated protein Cmr2
MGECLEKINSFDDLESFSKDVDKATIDATVEILAKHFKKDFSFQLILAGGDDLIIALPAHKAIDVAMEFCNTFETKLSATKFPVSISASVVICHDSMPIKDVLSMAESLIKNAKAESRKKSGGSYLDFAVLTGSSLEDPIKKRKIELEFSDNHCITKRPYSLLEMEKLITSIKEMKNAKFPNNKLNRLYQSLFKGHNQSILEGCYLRSKLESEEKKRIDPKNLEKFPWEETDLNKYTTHIGDIKELYEFIEVTSPHDN